MWGSWNPITCVIIMINLLGLTWWAIYIINLGELNVIIR